MTRRAALAIARVLVYAAVLGILTWQVWRQRDALSTGIAAVGWARCGAAELIVLAGAWPGMLGWRLLVTATVARLDLSTASRLYFVAGLGKYLPGGLWPALAQADLARALRLPPARLAMTFLGSVVLSIGAGFTVGLSAVPWLVRHDPVWWLLLPVCAAALTPVLAPRLSRLALSRVGRLVRRDAPTAAVPGRGTVTAATALMALGWAVAGLHVVVLAGAFRASASGTVLPLIVGGFALSSVASILAVVLPAGLGVREAVLVLTLGAVLTGGALVTVVALSRVLTIVADLISAAAAGTVTAGAGRVGHLPPSNPPSPRTGHPIRR